MPIMLERVIAVGVNYKARSGNSTLFLIFIKFYDLPDIVKHSYIRLFADDCILYRNYNQI